jgi:hypothetical protein
MSDGAADLSIVTHAIRHAFVCHLILFPNHCCFPSFTLLLGYDSPPTLATAKVSLLIRLLKS